MSLKVCYLLPRLLPGPAGTVVGGCAVNCVSLASALQERGVQIELLTTMGERQSELLDRISFAAHVKPFPVAGGGLHRRGLRAIRVLGRGLRATLRSSRFDVVHSHAGTYPYAALPLAADGRTCVRLHSLYCPLGAKGGVYSSWWDRPAVARMLFNRLDRVIAVTQNVRRSIEEAGVQSGMVESVPMCVDTQRFRPRTCDISARFFPTERNLVRLAFVGNSSKEKGLIELLHAMRTLLDKRMSVFLVAAVENQSEIKEYAAGYRKACDLIRELRLETHVRFLGMVDRIETLYAESDILVIPWKTSRGPSDFPLVALEAMAMGKCVVSTPVGGCPELLLGGDAGLLTDGFSAGNVAAAIEFAIRHPEVRKNAGQRATSRAQDFSLHTSVDRLISLYERLLEGKRRCDTDR